MAISHVETVYTIEETASTSHTADLPSFESDDVVVVILAATASVNPMGTYSTPSGWTEIGTAGGVSIATTSAVRLQCFYRVMQSGDSSTQTFTQSTSSGFKSIASTYRGCDKSDTINVSGTGTGDSTSATCPDVTTDEDGCMLIRCGACDDNETWTNSGVTERNVTPGIDAPGNGCSSASGDETQVSAGSTGTSVWTLGATEEWGCFTIALNPVLTNNRVDGITRSIDGSVLGSCDCYLFKDNLDNTVSFRAHVTSNATTGAYSFTYVPDTDDQYLVVALKDDTPHVFDVTDHVVEPAVSPTKSYDLYLRSDVDKGETSPDKDLRLRNLAVLDVAMFGANF